MRCELAGPAQQAVGARTGKGEEETESRSALYILVI